MSQVTRSFKKVAVLTGLTILLGSAEISSAATISQDQFFGPLSGPSSSTILNYNLFNPSQGTLSSFSLDLTSKIFEAAGVTISASMSGFPNSLSITESGTLSTTPTDINFAGLSSSPFDAFIGVGTFPLVFSYTADCGTSCDAGWSGDLKLIYVFDPVSQTPLPSGLPLFASGLGALGLLGWRRKRKRVSIAH
jgi:hypothetical protein